MGKAVLVAIWVTLGSPAVVQQIDVADIGKCEELASRMRDDFSRVSVVAGSPSLKAYCVAR